MEDALALLRPQHRVDSRRLGAECPCWRAIDGRGPVTPVGRAAQAKRCGPPSTEEGALREKGR